jgi:hypothetical protein
MGIPLWKDEDGKDWITNASTKPKMLEELKDKLSTSSITMLDSWTLGELRTFKVDERGRPFCPVGGVHHGDTVIGLALALQCIKTVRVPDRPYLPQWIIQRKVDQARNKGAQKEFRRY